MFQIRMPADCMVHWTSSDSFALRYSLFSILHNFKFFLNFEGRKWLKITVLNVGVFKSVLINGWEVYARFDLVYTVWECTIEPYLWTHLTREYMYAVFVHVHNRAHDWTFYSVPFGKSEKIAGVWVMDITSNAPPFALINNKYTVPLRIFGTL